MNHDGSSFLTVAASSTGFIFFSKEQDALSKRGTPNSSFFVFDDEDTDSPFRKYDENVHWPTISMATFKPEGGERVVAAIGHHGDFWELNPSTTVETLGKIAGAPVLRRVAAIGDALFACGMNRVVFERTGVGAWESVGPLGESDGIIGFEALGGFNADELYTAGWNGELWWRDAGTWRRVESGTSVNLKALTCASDGSVYIVGDDGVLLKGRRDQWSRVETGVTAHLRGVAEFGGAVHLLSSTRIFELGGAAFDGEDFLSISAANDGLVLLSRKHLHVKTTGDWRAVV